MKKEYTAQSIICNSRFIGIWQNESECQGDFYAPAHSAAVASDAISAFIGISNNDEITYKA